MERISYLTKGFMLTMASVSMLAIPAAAADISFFGTAKVKPTYYDNFDFDDSTNDAPIINEAGLTKGEHVRSELRLGWKAAGDKWKIKMIAEADVIMEKDTADRSFYVGAEKEGQPNTGGEFGIERAEFVYTFLPALELQAGWDVRFLDIKSGGLLYGDDHPFVGFRGKPGENSSYELLYIPIQNRVNLRTDPLGDSTSADWRVYSFKYNHDLVFGDSKMTFSPLVAYSDNEARDAQVTYYGLEGLGTIGMFKPSFEIVFDDGEFDATAGGADIGSMAAFAGVEMNVNKAFNPYLALRYAQGDDNEFDNDAEGFVGITDIARFTPLMGMDGNILGEDMQQGYGATLYSYTPQRYYKAQGTAGNNIYGGISNAGSGNNPGQKLFAIGTKGDLSDLLPNLSYKAQAFFIWYDETGNLVNTKNPGESVDDYAGTTFDLQVKYAFSNNFAIDYIFSTFVPGDGLEDIHNADDNAYVHALTLAWTY